MSRGLCVQLVVLAALGACSAAEVTKSALRGTAQAVPTSPTEEDARTRVDTSAVSESGCVCAHGACNCGQGGALDSEKSAEAASGAPATTGPVSEAPREEGADNGVLSGGETQTLTVNTVFWNANLQCVEQMANRTVECQDRAGPAIAQLAKEAGANVVATVDLEAGPGEALDLTRYGLAGWTQVNGTCQRDGNSDAATLAFDAAYDVERSGGGCVSASGDTFAFAVALAKPPQEVRGCPSLCFVALHAWRGLLAHVSTEEVTSVCGPAVVNCTVAMGDWDVPANDTKEVWSEVIGGSPPTLVLPSERTCCFPEDLYEGEYDHASTNIPGAAGTGSKVLDNLFTDEYTMAVGQHRPVSVGLSLPLA